MLLKLLTPFVLIFASLLLKRNRFKVTSPETKNLHDYYLLNQQSIMKLFKETKYWHGTGRYQYKKLGASKYIGTTNETFDVLKKIISDGGLLPQDDPWLLKQKGFIRSISLARCRAYAKWYYEYHMNENSEILYQYGDLRFWFRLIILFFVLYDPIPVLKSIMKFEKNSIRSKQAQQWLSSIRSDTNEVRRSWKEILRSSRSDITGNYGILFGINHKITEIPVVKKVELFEARTDKLIVLQSITHIEVPLSKVKEVREILSKAGVQIPVIAYEAFEIYAAKVPMKNLLFSH